MNDLAKPTNGLQGLSPNRPLFRMMSFPGADEGRRILCAGSRVSRYVVGPIEQR